MASVQAFGHNDSEQVPPGTEKVDLTKLLELSERLPGLSEGELTPIQAWSRLVGDDCFPHLTAEDFKEIQRQLIPFVEYRQ